MFRLPPESCSMGFPDCLPDNLMGPAFISPFLCPDIVHGFVSLPSLSPEKFVDHPRSSIQITLVRIEGMVWPGPSRPGKHHHGCSPTTRGFPSSRMHASPTTGHRSIPHRTQLPPPRFSCGQWPAPPSRDPRSNSPSPKAEAVLIIRRLAPRVEQHDEVYPSLPEQRRRRLCLLGSDPLDAVLTARRPYPEPKGFNDI